jgi:hypothetical protein
VIRELCPICEVEMQPLDVVDFNKACTELNGTYFNLSGFPVYYYICPFCDFVNAPLFKKWSRNDFSEKIYNSDYCKVDPDYFERRPTIFFHLLTKLFSAHKESFTHLDYGGGNGLLSSLLRKDGWKSDSIDPYDSTQNPLGTKTRYDLITAFEVFEHAPDPNILLSEISDFTHKDSVLFFSTQLTDGNVRKNQRLTWWYASPRNGHISLFSNASLELIAKKCSAHFHTIGEGLHLFYWGNPHLLQGVILP